MSSINLNYGTVNQKGTPLLWTDIFANRPQAAIKGRLFFSTDTSAIYEDTGSAWTLLANSSQSSANNLQQVLNNGNTADSANGGQNTMILLDTNGTGDTLINLYPSQGAAIFIDQMLSGESFGINIVNSGNVGISVEGSLSTCYDSVLNSSIAYHSYAYDTNSTYLSFNYNEQDQFIAKSNGNLLINTDTDAGYKLQVNGTTLSNGMITSWYWGTMITISSSGAIGSTIQLAQTYIVTSNISPTVTLDNPSSHNRIYIFKNSGTGVLTIACSIGANILSLAGTSVTTQTISSGQCHAYQACGNNSYAQLY